MRKKWIAAGCGLWMFFSGALCAFASGNGRFLESCEAKEGELHIFCSDIAEEEENREGCRVSLGSQELSVVSVESEKEADTPVTWYCLVDVSGSMNETQMAQIRETLLAVVDGFSEGDNMVISTLGNQADASGFLTDPEELRQIIRELAAGTEDTNLYAGIVESIQALETDTQVNPRKCLLILSDGKDDQVGGITETEPQNSIRDASIPVFTVAVLRDTPGEEDIANAKILGSFARLSTGGMHFGPGWDESGALETVTGAEAGEQILSRMQEGIVVTAELPAELPDKDELLLRMVYTSESGAQYEDTRTLYAEELKRLEETIAEGRENAAGTEEGTEIQPEPKPESKTALPWLIAGGAVILIVLAAAVAAVILRRRRQAQETGTRADGAADAKQEAPPVQESAKEEAAPMYGAAENTASAKEHKGKPQGYELRLYAVGYGDIVRTLWLEEGREVTVGRNGKADIILDGEDRKLSGVHCAVKWESGKLYVRDANSQNGTFVNGIPIKTLGRVAVHEGETIRMGSYEYRIGRR